jgi:Xaa-Pro dipeptidase
LSAPEHEHIGSPAPDSATAQRYRARQRRVAEHLAEIGIEAAVLVDLEGHRNRSLRYLCGHPQDALLFLFASGDTLLLPWDVTLARRLAVVGAIKAFEEYGRSEEKAIRSVLADAAVASAELPGTLAYPLVESLKSSLPDIAMSCRSDGLERRLQEWRALKDPQEVQALREACRITNDLLAEIETRLTAGRAPEGLRELDVALLLEAGARGCGAEGMGFETLAAGPARSFAIHCFPSVTGGDFAGQGFSILDFGVEFEGYTSDVTVTVVRGPLSAQQQGMLEAVRSAYELSCSLCEPGADPVEVARAVDAHLEGRGFHMPHSLGHGIGLDAHERPLLRSRGVPGASPPLAEGMVFTLEPGLYHPSEGGIRLENDFLCTSSGVEALTTAHFVRL